MLGVIGGKRQAFAMRQAQQTDDDPRHSAAERRARRASLARASSLAAVSSFYGGQIVDYLSETPATPTILHLGKTDELIPPEAVEAIRDAHPDVPVYIYEGAGHGFNNESPERYNAEAADLARHRTLELFDKATVEV